MKTFFLLIFLIPTLLYSQAQWETETNLISQYGDIVFRYINAVDSQIVWITGYRLGGNLPPFVGVRHDNFWESINTQSLINEGLNTAAGKDNHTGWVGTTGGKVFFTSNSGANWILQINAGGNSYVNSIKFSKVNPNFGYVYCDPPNGPGTNFKIYKTTNAGLNWLELSPNFGGNYYGFYRSMSVTDSQNVWLGLWNTSGSPAKVAHTSDGGTNWSIQNLPGSGIYATAVEFKSDNVLGFSSTNSSTKYLIRTTNSGNTWANYFPIQNIWDVNALFYIYTSSVWYFSTIEHIFKTSNDGLNWINMNAPLGNSTFVHMDGVKSGSKIYAWAIRDDGEVLRLIDTASVIGIHPVSSEIPNFFSLYQNYPNPFNPTTKLKFSLPKSSFTRIQIYNSLGNEIATIVNEDLKPGTYEVEWNASNFPSGVYYYKLSAHQGGSPTGDFTETKKMILLK